MMTNLFYSTLLVILIYFTARTDGHGRLIEPPSRSSMWRFGFNTPVNYDDNQLFCGGYDVSITLTRNRCYETNFILCILFNLNTPNEMQLFSKGALAIRRIFSLVDKSAHTKFSNCLKVFEIGVVRQNNVRSNLQDMFRDDSSFTNS